MKNIVIVSGHHPSETLYAQKTRKIFEKYTSLHNYDFYYDDQPALETQQHCLHYKRCESLRKASEKFPNAI